MTFKFPGLTANQTSVVLHFVTVFAVAFSGQMIASTTGTLSISALYAGLSSGVAAGVVAVLRAVTVIGVLDTQLEMGLSPKIKTAAYQFGISVVVMFLGTLGANLATGAAGATSFPDVAAVIVAAISVAAYAVVSYVAGLIPGPKPASMTAAASTPLAMVTNAMTALNTANETLRSGVATKVYNHMHPSLASVSGYLVSLKAWITSQPSPTPAPSPSPSPSPTPVPSPVPTPTPAPTPTPSSSLAALDAMAAAAGVPNRTWYDDFPGTTLNPANWNNSLISRAGGPWSDTFDNEFGLETMSPGQIAVSGGKLIITCSKATGKWLSGVVCTYGKHPVAVGKKHGYFWTSACPDSRYGPWTAGWGLPDSTAQYPSGSSGDRGEIDRFESGTGTNVNTVNGAAVSNNHGNGFGSAIGNDSKSYAPAGFDMTAEHNWGFVLDPGKSLTYWVDGVNDRTETTNVPTDPHELIFDFQMCSGANGSSGWHTVVGPNTEETYTFEISLVAAYTA